MVEQKVKKKKKKQKTKIVSKKLVHILRLNKSAPKTLTWWLRVHSKYRFSNLN